MRSNDAVMTVKKKLAKCIVDYVKKHKLSQSEAAVLFGTTQPRISYLVNGNFRIFTIDSIIYMLDKLNYDITVKCIAGQQRKNMKGRSY